METKSPHGLTRVRVSGGASLSSCPAQSRLEFRFLFFPAGILRLRLPFECGAVAFDLFDLCLMEAMAFLKRGFGFRDGQFALPALFFARGLFLLALVLAPL